MNNFGEASPTTILTLLEETAAGRVIGRARGQWLFFDIERRRPIHILDEIKQRWSFSEKLSIDHDITSKIAPAENSENTKTFPINRYDVDSYDHVNNIRYLYWLMESMPQDIVDNCYLHSIDGRFVTEAQYGDTLLSFTENDGSDLHFVHSVKTESNDRVCASARTIWKER